MRVHIVNVRVALLRFLVRKRRGSLRGPNAESRGVLYANKKSRVIHSVYVTYPRRIRGVALA